MAMDRSEATAGSQKARSKGEASREAILRAAADLTSIGGLSGLSIGALAKAVGMSKGGLYAHFGSKLELQRATIEMAHGILRRAVIAPAMNAAPGFEPLWAICEYYLAYAEGDGGGFFEKVAAGSGGKNGALRDRVAAIHRGLIGRFADCAREAQTAGELDAGADPHQLAFELTAFVRAASALYRLDDDRGHFARARFAIAQRLRSLLTERSPAIPAIAPPKRRERVPAVMRR